MGPKAYDLLLKGGYKARGMDDTQKTVKQKRWSIKNSTMGLGDALKPSLRLLINRPIDMPGQVEFKREQKPQVTYLHPMRAITWRTPTKREVILLGRTIPRESCPSKQPQKLVQKSYWRRISPPMERKSGQHPSLHIIAEEWESLPEDAVDAPPGLEEDVKVTVDELKEVNLEDPLRRWYYDVYQALKQLKP
ncbi:hypothetical protein LIER_19772 [Lithospermum erythrorhizon]|uniref:Uncharacterized protein n=1 Tax=Lithospermum erythrorhizon TaxID=34254 RepID=A0AAV3QM24_LITER